MNNCYLKSNIKKNCTGCTACMSICPKQAITMKEDSEGFKYPYIDNEKCINCGLCEKTCPIFKELPKTNPKALAYITNNEKDLLEATSGGAFGDIAKAYFEDSNTYIYGCTYDDNNKVIHKGINTKEQINIFKKSKYVQSDLLNVFIEIKTKLNENKKVLFSGTPCQTAGLKSFLKKDYDNLLCIDIICHGVPSQKLFDYYITCEEKKYKSKIKKVIFREKVKEKNGNYSLKNIKLVFEDGKQITKNVNDSSYFFGFQGRLFYRPSCYNCKYTNKNRYSDITICDTWAVGNPEDIKLNKGLSGIIINTKKGEEIINKINGKKIDIPVKYIEKTNECYTKSTQFNKKRIKFFKELNVENFEEKSFKYGKKSFLKQITLKIKNVIRKFIKK